MPKPRARITVSLGILCEVFNMLRGPGEKASEVIKEMVSHLERVEGKLRGSRT
jgi:hypothetical protein